METSYRLPSRLRTLRTDRGISQESLANSVGVSRRSIAMYETGGMVPTIGTAVTIADFFGVSLDSLVGREPLVIR